MSSVSDDELDRLMLSWWLPPEARQLAAAYAQHVLDNTYFTRAIEVSGAPFGFNGTLLALSTPLSASVCAGHVNEFASRGYTSDPDWLYYEVWMFTGKVLLNFHGYHDARHQGTRMQHGDGRPILLGEYFDGVLPRIDRTLTNWRQRFAAVHHPGAYYNGLRALLLSVGVCHHLEMNFGTSWSGYRCLDAYIKIITHGMPSHPDAAWFILNSTTYWKHRELKRPEEWYGLHDWVCVGQRPSITDDGFTPDAMVVYQSFLRRVAVAQTTLEVEAAHHWLAAVLRQRRAVSLL